MPKTKVNGKWIKYDSEEQRKGRIAGNANEYIHELKREFGKSLFLKFNLSPFNGSVTDKQLIKPSEVQLN